MTIKRVMNRKTGRYEFIDVSDEVKQTTTPSVSAQKTSSGTGLKVVNQQMKDIVLSNSNPKNDTIEKTKKNYSKFINFKI